jgi:lipopolysaccharide transport system ATP-binding protein
LTGRENILLKGVLIGLTRGEILDKMDEIINFSELEDFIDQPIRIYSSGMLAKLGFSIVASLDPEMLLIDEILAVGDIEFQKKCLQRMATFRERGVTIVFVSHSMTNVEQICDKVIWIENHVIKMTGETKTVVKAYAN